jgi:hypothetical protein
MFAPEGPATNIERFLADGANLESQPLPHLANVDDRQMFAQKLCR